MEPVPKKRVRAVNNDSHDDNKDNDDYCHICRCAGHHTKYLEIVSSLRISTADHLSLIRVMSGSLLQKCWM